MLVGIPLDIPDSVSLVGAFAVTLDSIEAARWLAGGVVVVDEVENGVLVGWAS